MKKRTMRKCYEEGGTMKGLIGDGTGPTAALGLASNIADATNSPNKYGRQSVGVTALKGAAAGASAGAVLGPWGAAVGGVVGGAVGTVKGLKQKKAQEKMQRLELEQDQKYRQSQYSALAVSNPEAIWGNKDGGYFANGGALYAEYIKARAKGGSLSTLSSDSVEVKGPSHEDGGVQLPGGNEVEGKETIKGNYVLSHRLGFAQAHKPLAKAIGKLEQKAPTKASVNSLQRLRSQEEALMLLQEYYKQQNNIE